MSGFRPFDPVVDDTALRNAVDNATYTSLTDGGEITINANPVLYDISAGSGIKMDFTDPLNPIPTKVEWSAFTAVAPPDIVGDGFTSIAIDGDGGLVALGGAQFSSSQFRLNIVLGTVVHTDSTIENTVSDPIPSYNVSHGILDYLRRAGGIVDGSRIILSNADLTFEQLAGVFTSPFINYANDKLSPSVVSNAAANPKSLTYSRTDGVGGFIAGASTTFIDPDNFDDLSGSLVSVTNNNWTFQPAYFFGQLNLLAVVYGQKEYNSLSLAVDGISLDFADMVINPVITGSATLLGFFVVEEGATDLTDEATAKFFSIGQALSGGSTITVSTLDQLTDTPATKVGSELEVARVNAAGTELEYIPYTRQLAYNAGEASVITAGNPVTDQNVLGGGSADTVYQVKDASGAITFKVKDNGEINMGPFLKMDGDNITVLIDADTGYTLINTGTGPTTFNSSGETVVTNTFRAGAYENLPITSDPSGITGASQVINVVHMTKADHTALPSTDPNILYILRDA